MSAYHRTAKVPPVEPARTHELRSEERDGMRIDWDVSIKMDDGLVLRGDVFRPVKDGRYPVILSYGPYAKGLAFQDGYPSAWERMATKHPDVPAGSTRHDILPQRGGLADRFLNACLDDVADRNNAA